MKQNRFTEEQIVRALKDLEAGEITVAEQARKLGCAEILFISGKRSMVVWKSMTSKSCVSCVRKIAS
jgi:hypothetical protein